MTMGRDLLEMSGPSGEDTLLHSLTDHIRQQNALLREQNKLARQLVPGVRTTTVVHNTNLAGGITDTNPHKITFEIGGKPVTVHKILIGGHVGGADNVRLALEPIGWDGGMTIPFITDASSTPFPSLTVLNISVSELYVVSWRATAYYINRQVSGADVWQIYGWTDDTWPNNISSD